ncbi:hypothetical protein PHYPSEUDO_012896 [Phytophthora pseudosyringae]|uniref:Uncharacterized protein n=1 Tax=Phytophthora pseudosyringae TaxID=221518 RepID=A0A8T1W6D2_9STRA|nr:hypothetical protein PHYPSEUDO_012896 [Phytophthora pseudosyringae]
MESSVSDSSDSGFAQGDCGNNFSEDGRVDSESQCEEEVQLDGVDFLIQETETIVNVGENTGVSETRPDGDHFDEGQTLELDSNGSSSFLTECTHQQSYDQPGECVGKGIETNQFGTTYVESEANHVQIDIETPHAEIARRAHTGEPLHPRYVSELYTLGDILKGGPGPRLSPKCNQAIQEMATKGTMFNMEILQEIHESRALEFCSQILPTSTVITVPRRYNLQRYGRLWLRARWLRRSQVSVEIAEQASYEEVGLQLNKSICTAASLRLVAIPVTDEDEEEEKREEDEQEQEQTDMNAQKDGGDANEGGGEGGGNDGGAGIADTSQSKVKAKEIAQKGVAGMQIALRMRRQKVDSTLQAIRVKRVMLPTGFFAKLMSTSLSKLMARLPSLLRLEIIRDFFQITVLFFSAMYGPVLDYIKHYRPSSWVLATLTWLRKTYSALAMDASELLDYLTDVMNIAGTGILLFIIVSIHVFFLFVVVRFWRSMPVVKSSTLRSGFFSS